MGWVGVGWGGADDVRCTWTHLWCYGDDDVPCAWTHLWCYGELGWVGVGWGWWRSLHMNTSLMLRRWWPSLHMNTSLKGVSHLTKVFTPTCKFWKGALSVRHAKTLQVHANKRDSLVKQSKRKFFVAGGDNRAENRLGQIKATMRRCSTLKGHYSSKYKRIQVLAAAALHRKPGIMSALNALQLYRNDCSSGKICVTKRGICSRQLELVRLKWEKKFLGAFKNSRNSFRLTGVAHRPPANGYNHAYIYIYTYVRTLDWEERNLLFNGFLGIVYVWNLENSAFFWLTGLKAQLVSFFRLSAAKWRCCHMGVDGHLRSSFIPCLPHPSVHKMEPFTDHFTDVCFFRIWGYGLHTNNADLGFRGDFFCYHWSQLGNFPFFCPPNQTPMKCLWMSKRSLRTTLQLEHVIPYVDLEAFYVTLIF